MLQNVVHQGQKLKYVIEKSNYTVEQIATWAGMHRTTIYNLFARAEIPRSKLEKICRPIGVEIDIFYGVETDPDQVIQDPTAEYRILQERVKSLEQMIEAKEVIIINQAEMIELLKEKRGKPKTK